MTSEILNLLGPTSSYKRRRRRRRDNFVKNGKFVPGIPLSFPRPEYKIKLPEFEIPPNLRKIFVMPEADALASDEFNIQLDNSSRYKDFFNTLLFAEEHKIEEDIKLYDQVEVKMKKREPFFILKVPGLAEKRPSVIPGDHVLVQYGEDVYQGFVHYTEERSVVLRFHNSFFNVYSSSEKFNVRFTFNRISMRRMHHALDAAEIINRLFPSNQVGSHENEAKVRETMGNLEFISEDIARNKFQKRAVATIKLGFYHPAPFIVFGPPGTGKSVTIVEAIKQILRDEENARILACAASNSAADGLLSKLITTLSTEEVVRINAVSRDLEKLDEGLLPFCEIPKVTDHRVVVSTCITAGAIYTLKGNNEYTHIFVDEAGQALEPEVLTALQNASKDTKIILAGDPKQLGPIIHSSIAKKLHLGISLIERLVHMENSPYDFGETSVYGVKLLRNYRSHHDILRFSNNRFYDNELRACGDHKITYSLIKSHILPKKNYPVMFVGVNGKDQREGHSPSWFNAHEAAVVLELVRKLVVNDKVRPIDIGVVTPYCKQVEKIKKLMDIENFGDVDVGTVENFQGREQRVIIVSTVRSSTANAERDRKFRLGFLDEPKRFCVATTRARALLAVVGNPNILSMDDCWKGWLRDVKAKGGCTGMALPVETEENNE